MHFISNIIILKLLFLVCNEVTGQFIYERGKFPAIFNLASIANISVNATCGTEKTDYYCKLVEHVRRRPSDNTQCGRCDASSLDLEDRHPITNAIDGTNNWWQSPSIAEGRKYEWVTITINLKQIYQVAYIIIKAANSPRPGNWILEKSIDGINYEPWQYFAISDYECWHTYGIAATIGPPRYRSDDEVICVSSYSRLDPLENGEIHISLVNGRPGIYGPRKTLVDFTSARYIQLRFQKLHTLNADLMTFITQRVENVDPSVTNRYFYSVKDISIGGQCICFGHASKCIEDTISKRLRCECEQNTCGDHCEYCCSGYNQKPWREGTYSAASYCEECNCFGHSEECTYNSTVADLHLSLNSYGEFEGGGVCLNCRDNTMGINCEQCLDGFYRPSGVDPRQPDACVQCECDGSGTTGKCVKDDAASTDGKAPGSCICREGFTGPKCDRCQDGYRGYPLCEPCPCNRAGSLNADVCEGACKCKALVVGPECDKCAEGHYNLDVSNPEGCSVCFCFDVTSQCRSLEWPRVKIDTLYLWNVTAVRGGSNLMLSQSNSHLVVEGGNNTEPDALYYWTAPPLYLGDKLVSYGGLLEYGVYYTINQTLNKKDAYISDVDVILEGNGIRLGILGRISQEEKEYLTQVQLTEHQWQHVDEDLGLIGSKVTKEEFMIVLANLKRLMIRATYHKYILKSQLLYVKMDVAHEEGVSNGQLSSVEKCQCPEGYSGTSCQTCERGYRRVNDQLVGGRCEKCECHGFADVCDPVTGHCKECSGNTTGPHCEECLTGYYGDPKAGRACVKCACPLKEPSNNFATSCSLVYDSNGTESSVCIGCEEGYQGKFCERCAEGYYGNPNVIGGQCLPCDCHGNLDLNRTGSCNNQTGACVLCVEGTEGDHCEMCASGFYGSAVEHNCKVCSCNAHGSINVTVCNRTTGQCDCKPRYTGKNCDRCQLGFGNILAGCLPCNCSAVGSVSDLCDPVSGQCECRSGVTGVWCNRCKVGHFNLTDSGCQECRCDQLGSNSSFCDVHSGQCQCRDHVTGRRCDQCEPGYWGMESGQGCRTCGCSETGSWSAECDPLTGQCSCKPGVNGSLCDQCVPGFYNFSSRGCTECRKCPLPYQVCDPVTGVCHCPPNTEGELCDRCKAYTWGYDPVTGCKECDCNNTGAVTLSCDLLTGQCQCNAAFTGHTCSECKFGHYGFPQCHPCQCDRRGTEPDQCDTDGQCQCDRNGQCFCKEHAYGAKCDRCKKEAFSLSVDNPRGCTECFCFGRTGLCTAARLRWSKVALRSVEMTFLQDSDTVVRTDLPGLAVIPPNVTDVSIDPVHSEKPLYSTIVVSGDKTASYGGKLRFTLYYEHLDEAVVNVSHVISYPLVQIVGNYRLYLEYYTDQAPTPGVQDKYEVPIHEDFWYMRNDPNERVSRETLMVTLQNVQSVFFRVTDGARVSYVKVSNITWDHAVPSEYNTFHDVTTVEECTCPPIYAGLSCQDPSDGNYRRRPDDLLDRDQPLDLIGGSVPCECNSHSFMCHHETGICQDCKDSTTGDHCEECLPGFYGNATHGTLRDCKPCACPSMDPENSFSATCQASGSDYVCDDCVAGYTGQYCQLCGNGFYKFATDTGYICKPCECYAQGSESSVCNKTSGQCPCKEGIRGRVCDKCEERYAVVSGTCKSCDVGCTALIMADMDAADFMLDSRNISSLIQLPWNRLFDVDNVTSSLREELASFKVAELGGVIKDLGEIKYEIHNVKDKSSASSSHHGELAEETGSINKDATLQESEITKIHTDLKDVIDKMIATIEKNKHTETGGLHVDEVIKMADEILANVSSHGFSAASEKAEEQMTLARKTIADVRKIENKTTNTSAVDERLENLSGRLSNMLTLLTDLNSRGANQSKALFILREHMESLKNMMKALWLDTQKLQAQLSSGFNANLEASKLVNDSVEGYKDAVQLKTSVVQEMNLVEEKGGLIEQNLPASKSYVAECQDHILQLQNQSNTLELQFSGIREVAQDPLRAARAYAEIVKSINEAHWAASNASAEVDDADKEMMVSLGGKPEELTQKLIKRSKMLKVNATRNDTDIKTRLPVAVGNVTSLESLSQQAERDVEQLNSEMDKMKTDMKTVTEKLQMEGSTAVNKSAAAASRAADVVKQHSDMKSRIEKLKKIPVRKIMENTTNSVSEALQRVHRLHNLSAVLDAQMVRMREMQADMSDSLQQLRSNIHLARQQANKIRISLENKGGCSRRYEIPTLPSTANTISLQFKTPKPNQNMLLFLLNSKRQPDHLSLALVDGKVQFSWNAGGNTKTLIHDLKILPSNKGTDNWYTVQVQRNAKLGKLKVFHTSSSDPHTEVTGQSKSDHVRMDIESSDDLYIGGVPKNYVLPEGLSSGNFIGCIGRVYLDGEHIGVYNFREIEGQNKCGGCREGFPADIGDRDYHFGGDGFVELPSDELKLDKESFSIQLSFKTFWSDALLVFVGNSKNKDYISLYLKDGKLVFQFAVGGTDPVQIVTEATYNNNKWVKIKATRNKAEGILMILSDGTIVKGKLKSDKYEMDLANYPIYFGGVLKTLDISSFGSRFGPPFLGCMRNVTITGQKSSRLDLMSHVSAHVEQGCGTKKSRVVGFPGDNGFVEVEDNNIDEVGDISLSFITKQANALILLAISDDKKSYYSVSLSGGKARVIVSTGGAEVTLLPSTYTYNDGLLHSLALTRKKKKLVLVIDEEVVGEATIKDMVDEKTKANKGRLYLGGLPPGLDVGDAVASKQNIKGCIRDIAKSGKFIDLDDPVNFERADIGRCSVPGLFPKNGSSPIFITLPIPTTTIPTTPRVLPKDCAQFGTLTYEPGAVAFGDIKHSNAQILVKRKYTRDFNVSVEFRTYFTDGLIFYVTNEKQSEFVTVQMNNSRVVMSYTDKGQKPTDVVTTGKFNDGAWHKLRVSKERKTISIQMDKKEPHVGMIARKLDVIAPMYVGGLPDVYKIRAGLLSESFKGCMRNYKLNNKTVDLLNSKAIMGVRRCYKIVEEGTYFPNIGHAVYNDYFQIKREFSTAFEFRTTKFDGILMTVSGPEGYPAMTIEIHQGELKFTIKTEKVTLTVKVAECMHCLCDNNWHHVFAHFKDNTLTLKVDGWLKDEAKSGTDLGSLEPYSALYIGGYPVYAEPQGASHTVEYFHGCIRGLQINGVPAPWQKMVELVDVHVNSCPITVKDENAENAFFYQ